MRPNITTWPVVRKQKCLHATTDGQWWHTTACMHSRCTSSHCNHAHQASHVRIFCGHVPNRCRTNLDSWSLSNPYKQRCVLGTRPVLLCPSDGFGLRCFQSMNQPDNPQAFLVLFLAMQTWGKIWLKVQALHNVLRLTVGERIATFHIRLSHFLAPKTSSASTMRNASTPRVSMVLSTIPITLILK